MTSEWHEVPLRELVGYISKGIAPSYAEEASETTIRVLNQKCNRNFRISYGDSRLHDTLKKKVPPERYVKPDDILINSTGAGTAGRIAQIEDVPSATTIDGHMILIRSNGKVTQKFLGYALKAHQWEVLQLDEGSTGQTELNRDRLLDEIMINYPVSFDEQNAIVGTLESIDRKLIVNEQLNDNLHQQAAALFSSLYDRSNTEVRFTDLIQILGGGTPKTGENTYWNGNIAFFTPKDVGIPYTLITEKTISKEGLSHCNSRLYPVNTVFVTARGTVGKVGMSGVPMAMNQSCYALVGKETHQLLVYFYTLKAVDRLKHKASGAVFDAITTRDFESEQIMKLSDDDATAFLRVAEPMFQEVLNNNIENLRLSTLRDSLLPKLMSGEIDVSAVQL